MSERRHISIALVGAPGAGKAHIRDALWNEDFSGLTTPIVPVINSGQTIEETFDTAMGIAGSHHKSLWAHFERYREELDARKFSFVVSGTIVDNLAHAAAYQEMLVLGPTSPDIRAEIQEANIFLSTLTCILLDTFSYNFVFHVPFQETDDAFDNDYSKRVEKNIEATIVGLGLGIQKLEATTDEGRVQEVKDTIQKILDDSSE